MGSGLEWKRGVINGVRHDIHRRAREIIVSELTPSTTEIKSEFSGILSKW